MKKISKILLVFILVFSLSFITGCNQNNTKETESNTVASKLAGQFKNEIKQEKDIQKVAKSLSENEAIKIAIDVVELDKDSYITGFTNEITGFKKAVTIRPIIGSIPFVAYIFEVDNAKTFEKTLKENADLRWNICTEADNMETVVAGNYVFFVMSPENFD